MIDPTTMPEATAKPEDHADYLELTALRSSERSVSFQELVRDFRIANATEAIADSAGFDNDDDSDDGAEPLAEAAFNEIDDRIRACDQRADCYPFILSDNTVKLRDDADESLYIFLALLSWYGKDAGPRKSSGEQIFEDICAKATEAYLGGPDERVKSVVFGFPRRVLPAGFKDALDSLCIHLGEGIGHHKGRAKTPHEKDAKLDVVAWREFADSRPGKLIAFGQCATGKNWAEKVSELPQTYDWCSTWMAERPMFWPIRTFYVPHRIDQTNWFHAVTFGGLLYDRCRIASLASKANSPLKEKWVQWSAHVLGNIRQGA